MIKTYSELIRISSFLERYKYLRLSGIVGESTFGFDRYLNQSLYTSKEWRDLRHKIIVRDNGCDLAMDGYEINSKILIHHMNPISENDILNHNPDIFNPEYLVCVSHDTHNAIHYGDETLLQKNAIVERFKNDTCPWKK